MAEREADRKIHGWSRVVLTVQIESRLHVRQGKALTNFDRTLPPERSDLAQQTLKDPYVFDFLTLGEDARERELEQGLIDHIIGFDDSAWKPWMPCTELCARRRGSHAIRDGVQGGASSSIHRVTRPMRSIRFIICPRHRGRIRAPRNDRTGGVRPIPRPLARPQEHDADRQEHPGPIGNVGGRPFSSLARTSTGHRLIQFQRRASRSRARGSRTLRSQHAQRKLVLRLLLSGFLPLQPTCDERQRSRDHAPGCRLAGDTLCLSQNNRGSPEAPIRGPVPARRASGRGPPQRPPGGSAMPRRAKS